MDKQCIKKLSMKKPFDKILNIISNLSDDEREMLLDSVQDEIELLESDIDVLNKQLDEMDDDEYTIDLSKFMTQEEIFIFNTNKHITGMT